GIDSRVAHHRRPQGHLPRGARGARRRGLPRAAARTPGLDPERAGHPPEERARRARQGARDPRPHLRDRGRGRRHRRRSLHRGGAGRADDPARGPLRLGEHAPRGGPRRPPAGLLHDRSPRAREGPGPARLPALHGALLRAAAGPLRRPPRAARGPAGRPPDPRVLPAEPRAPRPGGPARRPGDELMAIKPEELLRAIAALRGDAVCVPTMTTVPAWRAIAPDALADLDAFRRRFPATLREEGPVLVELSTGLAEQTPMTAPGGKPFSQQVEELRGKLRGL